MVGLVYATNSEAGRAPVHRGTRSRYLEAKDPVERSHAQILWLLAWGESAKRVAEITGYSACWVSEIVRRYNEGGLEALGDRRHENPGGRFLLHEAQRRELAEALGGVAPDGGSGAGRRLPPESRR